jgi:hypothetical protein
MSRGVEGRAASSSLRINISMKKGRENIVFLD